MEDALCSFFHFNCYLYIIYTIFFYGVKWLHCALLPYFPIPFNTSVVAFPFRFSLLLAFLDIRQLFLEGVTPCHLPSLTAEYFFWRKSCEVCLQAGLPQAPFIPFGAQNLPVSSGVAMAPVPRLKNFGGHWNEETPCPDIHHGKQVDCL